MKMIYLKTRNLHALLLIFCLVSFATFLLRDPLFLLSQFHIISRPCGCRPLWNKHYAHPSLCISELEEVDPWFRNRFNTSVEPLLFSGNCKLSNETYNWWMWLQAEDNPSNLNAVTDKLFQVIPDKRHYMDAGPYRCRSCSVVGNSGNLQSSNYGKLIDSSDFVIRINEAPTHGFERDVGNKTTHHVMYPESAIDLPNDINLILIPFKILDLEWLTSALTSGHINFTYQPVKTLISANRKNVMVYNPSFMKHVHKVWLEDHGRYPSTGFLSIMFALHVCDQVKVFGFGADRGGNWHHYWENNLLFGSAFKETGVHDADFEYNIMVQLALTGKIRFFRGM
ncbi:CMP-N-acetylneuraminate-beta-galactosamide-alpha-2,3-sialyltransferase 1-like isoform 1-T1 [Clarias gariepinus]